MMPKYRATTARMNNGPSCGPLKDTAATMMPTGGTNQLGTMRASANSGPLMPGKHRQEDHMHAERTQPEQCPSQVTDWPDAHRDEHPAHRKRGRHSPDHRVGEVAGQRCRMQDEAYRQEGEQHRGDDCGTLGNPGARQHVLPRQSEACDTQRQPRDGGGEAAHPLGETGASVH